MNSEFLQEMKIQKQNQFRYFIVSLSIILSFIIYQTVIFLLFSANKDLYKYKLNLKSSFSVIDDLEIIDSDKQLNNDLHKNNLQNQIYRLQTVIHTDLNSALTLIRGLQKYGVD